MTVVTDLQLSGTAAQPAGAVVTDRATQLTQQFAASLQGPLGEAPAAPVEAVKPVSGLSLLHSLPARFRR